MRYVGSKRRIAKYILPIILKDRLCGQPYVEPFVGAFNTMCMVDGTRLANDLNYYLIELFRAIQAGWIPPRVVTEDEYKEIQANPSRYPAELVGFVGIGCSFGGKWFGGYARGGKNANGQPRNYANESCKSLLKQRDSLKGVCITCYDYSRLHIPPASIIYCDPPYANTEKYKDGDFDYPQFWDWCRFQVRAGHRVFVSEYTAPPDWKCVWSKEVCNTLDKDTGSKKGVEKLFIHNTK